MSDPVGQHIWIPELGSSQSMELLGSSAEEKGVGWGSYHQVSGTGVSFCPFIPMVLCPHPPLTWWGHCPTSLLLSVPFSP